MPQYASLLSRALEGMHAQAVQVEVHFASGLPQFTLVGLAETEVKEARERVRAAIVNAGFEFPANKRITVNLAPADLPKDSGRFDLPIALGILAASGQLNAAALADVECAGELSLSGALVADQTRYRWCAGHGDRRAAGWTPAHFARRQCARGRAPARCAGVRR